MELAVKKSPMLITTSWDDGHPLDLRIAELLVKYNLPGTFYIPIRNLRPTLSAAQIRELGNHFEIGAHTVNHVRLATVDLPHAKAEIIDSKRQLEDILGRPCSIFCFPGGSYNSSHLDVLSDAGFKAVRTVELLSLERPRTRHQVAVIPTTIQAYSHSTMSYLRNLTKRVSVRGFGNLLFSGATRAWWSMAQALLERASAQGGVFHLWGHSWEIEQHGEWDSLARVLARLADYRGQASLHSNTGVCGI